MTKPKLSERAAADLDEVWDFIAANNLDAANRVVVAILEGAQRHVQFPGMGQNRENFRPGLRSFVVSPYVVFYRAVDDTIEVLRIVHTARDISRITGLGVDDRA